MGQRKGIARIYLFGRSFVQFREFPKVPFFSHLGLLHVAIRGHLNVLPGTGGLAEARSITAGTNMVGPRRRSRCRFQLSGGFLFPGPSAAAAAG